jgi:hypothetical protein
MAIIGYLFTARELKALPKKYHATLLNEARRLVRTSSEVRKVVKHEPVTGYLDENSSLDTSN